MTEKRRKYYDYVKSFDTEENFLKHKIYGLINPVNNECFYIGVTKYLMTVRISSHLNNIYITKICGQKKEK